MSTVEKENQNLSTIIFHVLEAVQYNMHPIDQAAGKIRYKKGRLNTRRLIYHFRAEGNESGTRKFRFK